MIDEKNFKKRFAIKLNKLRKQRAMTQSELATELNYSDKAISKWERGESIPDALTLYKIAELFGVKIDDLFSDNMDIMASIPVSRKIKPTKIFVPIIVSLGIFFIFSIIFFVMYNIESAQKYAFTTFLFALPAMSIALTIFSSLWWKLRYSCIFASLIIWSLGLVMMTTLKTQGSLFLLVPCVILQAACILVYILIYYATKSKDDFNLDKED